MGAGLHRRHRGAAQIATRSARVDERNAGISHVRKMGRSCNKNGGRALMMCNKPGASYSRRFHGCRQTDFRSAARSAIPPNRDRGSPSPHRKQHLYTQDKGRDDWRPRGRRSRGYCSLVTEWGIKRENLRRWLQLSPSRHGDALAELRRRFFRVVLRSPLPLSLALRRTRLGY